MSTNNGDENGLCTEVKTIREELENKDKQIENLINEVLQLNEQMQLISPTGLSSSLERDHLALDKNAIDQIDDITGHRQFKQLQTILIEKSEELN